MPETARSVALLSQRTKACAQGKYVDIVGVTGSIPVTPTIQIPCIAGLSSNRRACLRIGLQVQKTLEGRG